MSSDLAACGDGYDAGSFVFGGVVEDEGVGEGDTRSMVSVIEKGWNCCHDPSTA